MARYKLTKNDSIYDRERCMSINDKDSFEYYLYLKWLNEGSPRNIPDPAYQRSLDEYKVDAHRRIDEFAESIRAKYITLGSGQAMTYQEKSEEATDYVSAGYPVMGEPPEYPFIHVDAVAFNITHQEAADQILEQRTMWISIGSAIERIRLEGKRLINEATTEEEINTIIQNTINILSNI